MFLNPRQRVWDINGGQLVTPLFFVRHRPPSLAEDRHPNLGLYRLGHRVYSSVYVKGINGENCARIAGEG